MKRLVTLLIRCMLISSLLYRVLRSFTTIDRCWFFGCDIFRTLILFYSAFLTMTVLVSGSKGRFEFDDIEGFR
jgi:hypothetical protein